MSHKHHKDKHHKVKKSDKDCGCEGDKHNHGGHGHNHGKGLGHNHGGGLGHNHGRGIGKDKGLGRVKLAGNYGQRQGTREDWLIVNGQNPIVVNGQDWLVENGLGMRQNRGHGQKQNRNLGGGHGGKEHKCDKCYVKRPCQILPMCPTPVPPVPPLPGPCGSFLYSPAIATLDGKALYYELAEAPNPTAVTVCDVSHTFVGEVNLSIIGTPPSNLEIELGIFLPFPEGKIYVADTLRKSTGRTALVTVPPLLGGYEVNYNTTVDESNNGLLYTLQWANWPAKGSNVLIPYLTTLDLAVA